MLGQRGGKGIDSLVGLLQNRLILWKLKNDNSKIMKVTSEPKPVVSRENFNPEELNPYNLERRGAQFLVPACCVPE